MSAIPIIAAPPGVKKTSKGKARCAAAVGRGGGVGVGGISGHQNIRPQSALGWVEAVIREELLNQRASVGVSSLAAGADQIFAEMGLDLEAVIPCAGYEKRGKKRGQKKGSVLNGANLRAH